MTEAQPQAPPQAPTPKEIIENTLPSKFDPAKAVGLDCILQMNITGPGGGSWQITIKDGKCAGASGTHPSPTLNVTMSDENLVKMATGKLGAMAAYMTGKLIFKGDMATGMKLWKIGIFSF